MAKVDAWRNYLEIRIMCKLCLAALYSGIVLGVHMKYYKFTIKAMYREGKISSYLGILLDIKGINY